MELHRIAVRALFAYLVLLALLRSSGKRTVAEGTPFAFVLALILGDMVDDLLWAEVGAAQFAVAVATLTTAQIVTAWAASRWEWLDRLVEGSPTPVMMDGAPRRAGQRRVRMNDKTLAFELRHHGIDRAQWGIVESANVEDSGALSVLRRREERPADRRDAAGLVGSRGRR